MLNDEVKLDEIVIGERRQSTLTSRVEPLQTHTLTFDVLCRAACCNLAESFATHPSVDVS